MFDDKRIAELRALRGQGMVSAVGELWEALDEIERLRAEKRDLMKRTAAGGLVAVGTVLLGDTDGSEIEDWDVEWERKSVDAINETRPESLKKLRLFIERPNAELRGAKPIGEASRSNDVLGVE